MSAEVLLEYEKINAQQNVERHFGSAGGEEDRYHVRRVGVGIRQPDMQRENRSF